ncbi:hypothetical protein CLOM_g20874 [Closterium sp. NIES-68]|nr:hypothetical protein CLOM_g20874 [Closterium sp. NIES-68]GJP68505.1 hypothetical protein CLOP_g25202 [Closterium sp. NIES-67]
MWQSLARSSLGARRRGVGKAVLGAAWVALWVGLCAWVVWFAHRQAASPRQEAIRVWCRTRVRYLHQDMRSAIARAQESTGLMKVFGRFGPRSSSSLQYWGVAGCVNNATLLKYTVRADQIANYSSSTVVMVLNGQDRATAEAITGYQVHSVLGLPAPRKRLYAVNLCGSTEQGFYLPPFTDFAPLVPPHILASLLAGKPSAGPPLSLGPGYVASVFVIPILRHPLPPSASPEQIRESISTGWAAVIHLEWRARDILNMLENGSTAYSFELYDSTQPGELVQIFGPQQPRLERGAVFPFVLPVAVVPPSDHVEPFPEGLFGRTYQAHCSFQGAYPRWDLVYAPMLLGLLVLLLALLLSTLIAVLAWKRRRMAEGVREMALCTAALERAERNKSETVANLSHELRTPIVGMIGMIDVLLESALEEWQRADLRDASACAGETVHLINRVLDLAKLQAGRLQLEDLPCCLASIAEEAVALAAQDAFGKGITVTCHVDQSVPPVLIGDPTRLLQVVGELAAHAVSNTPVGHVTFRLWCIAPHSQAPTTSPSQDQAVATPSPACHSSAASQASAAPQSPPAPSPWHQLAACARRFPPPTRLACGPQPLAKSRGGCNGRLDSEGGREGGGGHVRGRGARGGTWGGGTGRQGERSGSGGRASLGERAGLGERVMRRGKSGVDHGGAATGVGARGAGATCMVEPQNSSVEIAETDEMQQGILQQGRHDARSGDASTGDASTRDAGTRDAGTRDAGTRDAGTRGAGTSVEEQGGGGRLEREVAAWVEGACRARGEGEWMVVMACEDTSGGIPPAEMRWVLDPHGHSPHPKHTSSDAAVADTVGGGGCGGGGGGQGERGSSKKRRSIMPHPAAPLTHDQRAAARPAWTPYPLRFLLSTSLVAEMRGAMAALSHAATGTTILLALPMGGGEGAASRWDGEGDKGGEGVVAAVQAGQQVAGSSGLGGCTPCHAAAAVEPAALQQHVTPEQSLFLRGGSVGGCERSGTGAAESAEAAVRGVMAGLWVAVVDDNAVNRMVARRTLQGYGAHVLLLQSGEDALHALSTRAPSPPLHLLLLDLHMPPGIDGFETARRIRGMERTQQVPNTVEPTAAAGLENQGTEVGARRKGLCIIALTADLDVGVKKACLEAGMDGAVRKPIVAHELLAALTGAGFGVAPMKQGLFYHIQSL